MDNLICGDLMIRDDKETMGGISFIIRNTGESKTFLNEAGTIALRAWLNQRASENSGAVANGPTTGKAQNAGK
jgi:hypothetical protein